MHPDFAVTDHVKKASTVVQDAETTSNPEYGMPGLQLLELRVVVVLVLIQNIVTHYLSQN
jgi:hypothetical protein